MWVMDDLPQDYRAKGFQIRKGCVDQIFTLQEIGDKAQEKKRRVYVGFMDLEKVYNKAHREALKQVPGIEKGRG